MRTRTILVLVGALALGTVVLGGAGMALAWGQHGGSPWSTSGPGTMMGGQYNHGSMMGGQYSHGSMMGGASGTSTQGQGTQGTQGSPSVGATKVQMANFAFAPAYIQVKAGTTVTWTNQDAAPHTVTFRSGMMHSSAMMQQGQTFSYMFTTPGTYTYYCAVHPNMTAQVVVTP